MMMMILVAEGSLGPIKRPREGGDDGTTDSPEDAALAEGQVSVKVKIKA